jgi:nucleoside-diphosphate kinase
MAVERTFFMIKPDGVQRNLIGEVVSRVLRKGYKICAMKMMRIDPAMAKRHYAEHEGKPFFGELVSFITSGPVVAFVIEGENAVEGVRQMMGKTNPRDSPQGTIRGDLGVNLSRNVVHGSDSTTSAIREISIFFGEKEILEYDRQDETWIYP